MGSKRLTLHNQRRSKENGGVLSQDHPEHKDFDLYKAKHIDQERIHLNDYWRNPNLGVEPNNKSRKQFLKELYTKIYGPYIIKHNEKKQAQRKYKDFTDVDKMLKSSRTCLEGTIFYLGNKHDYADRETHLKVRDEYIEEHNKMFPQCPIVAAETHCDEQGAIHTTFWKIYMAHDNDGTIIFHQGKALEEMNIQNNNKKKDNAKKIYTKQSRALCAEIAKKHGVELILEPKQGKGGQDLEDYKRDQAKEEFEQFKAATPTQDDLDRIKKSVSKKKTIGGYVISEKDFNSLVNGCAVQERIDPLQRPLSQVEKDKIFNQIFQIFDEKYHSYHDKHLPIEETLKEKVDFVRNWLKEKHLFEEFTAAFKQFKMDQKNKRYVSAEQVHDMYLDRSHNSPVNENIDIEEEEIYFKR